MLWRFPVLMLNVTRLQDLVSTDVMHAHFARHGLSVQWVENGLAIPGSHWGDEEAGLIENCLFVRADTPVHSALHEGGHWLLMPDERRAQLHTNAGGTLAEENAVCYLQVLMADSIDGYDRATLFKDMDAWGYSFRLGSAMRWFDEDATDALEWLQVRQPELLKQYGCR